MHMWARNDDVVFVEGKVYNKAEKAMEKLRNAKKLPLNNKQVA